MYSQIYVFSLISYAVMQRRQLPLQTSFQNFFFFSWPFYVLFVRTLVVRYCSSMLIACCGFSHYEKSDGFGRENWSYRWNDCSPLSCVESLQKRSWKMPLTIEQVDHSGHLTADYTCISYRTKYHVFLKNLLSWFSVWVQHDSISLGWQVAEFLNRCNKNCWTGRGGLIV
jgi:hypothetical protein